MRRLAFVAFLIAAVCCSSDITWAQNITIQGRTFYKDSELWVPKGIQIEGLNRPLGDYESASMQAAAKEGKACGQTKRPRSSRLV
jgi:endoglucanase